MIGRWHVALLAMLLLGCGGPVPTATPSQTSVVGEGERLSAGRRRRATSSSDDNGLSLLATARLAWELYAI